MNIRNRSQLQRASYFGQKPLFRGNHRDPLARAYSAAKEGVEKLERGIDQLVYQSSKTAVLQERLQQVTDFLHVEDRAVHADQFLPQVAATALAQSAVHPGFERDIIVDR